MHSILDTTSRKPDTTQGSLRETRLKWNAILAPEPRQSSWTFLTTSFDVATGSAAASVAAPLYPSDCDALFGYRASIGSCNATRSHGL